LVRELHAVGVAGLLYLSAALALLPWSLSHRPDPVALQRTWRLVALGVVVGGAAGPALLTAGLVNTPAASASLLLNLELVATVAGVLLVWAPGTAWSWSGLWIVGAVGGAPPERR
jgi:drug/metabolite transporter (DMT)-like permease